MRVAVRRRKGVRMRMKTRAVKRAWWTRTPTPRKRVRGPGLGRCGTVDQNWASQEDTQIDLGGVSLRECSETACLDRARIPE